MKNAIKIKIIIIKINKKQKSNSKKKTINGKPKIKKEYQNQ